MYILLFICFLPILYLIGAVFQMCRVYARSQQEHQLTLTLLSHMSEDTIKQINHDLSLIQSE